jgi:tripartite-type tricarboxylate transporter receptor subunit TctC
LFTEAFKAAAHVDVLHVPYKGEGPAVMDIVGNKVSMMFGSIPAVLPQIKAGKLRALAASGRNRMPLLPHVPTLQESGVAGLDWQAWWAFVAPAKTPTHITSRLSNELIAALNTPELVAALERQGAVVAATSPQGLTEHIKAQMAFFSRLAKAINFKVED